MGRSQIAKLGKSRITIIDIDTLSEQVHRPNPTARKISVHLFYDDLFQNNKYWRDLGLNALYANKESAKRKLWGFLDFI